MCYIYIYKCCVARVAFQPVPVLPFQNKAIKQLYKNKTVLVRLQFFRPPAVKQAMDMCVFRAATLELPPGPGDLSVGAWT